MATADAERNDRLREKYTQLKQTCAVLKSGLRDKQEDCLRLEQQLREKETVLRQQLEESDKLQFQNSRLTKQLGTLTAQVEEQKQRLQQQQSGWSVQSLMSGRQQQEAQQKAEAELAMLQDHMMMKIQENEELHSQLFEAQNSAEEEIRKLKEGHSAAALELEKQSSDLEAQVQQNRRMRTDIDDLEKKLQLAQEQIGKTTASLQASQSSLELERLEAKKQIAGIERRLSRLIPFDEGEHAPWNTWNADLRHGMEARKHCQAMQRLRAGVAEACNQSSQLLHLWTKAMSSSSGRGEDGPPQRVQVRTRMSEAAQRLASAIQDVMPDMVGSVGVAQAGAHLPWDRELGRTARSLLSTHRKWIAYQSMLLLYDGGGDSLVGCLWDVHRCVRALFTRLRLLACTSPMLQTGGASSLHFSLVRSLMGRQAAQDNFKEAQTNFNLGNAVKSSGSRSPASLVSLPRAALLQFIGKSLRETAGSLEVLVKTLGSACGESHESHGVGALGNADGTSMAELLEALRGLCSCLVDRVCPLVEQLGHDSPITSTMPIQCGLLAGRNGSLLTEAMSGSGPESCAENGCLNVYWNAAVERLRQAPGSIGFEEARQTLALARRLTVEDARGKEALKQQGERLLVMTREKSALSDELQSLQDKHELLRSNLQVLEAAAAHKGNGAATSQWAGGGGAASSEPAATAGAWGGLVLSSRQRALLESVTVTAQESASLRQHGFFVDVISLTAGEATLASGPPSVPDPIAGSETWEEAVRKVYEQHCRSLQLQVQAADGRAVDLQLAVQQSADLRREQEEVKQKLLGEVENKHAQLERVSEDIATTRRSYDTQLSTLTEHLCNLSVRLSEKDESLASLQAQKILCGHCGMWNVMGKLLSKEGGGTCNTCKEKLLS